MCGIVAVRIASGVGFLSLLLFTAALIAFPSLPTTGAGLSATHPSVVVNRAHKGDRLPTVKPANRPDELGLPLSPARAMPPGAIPPGCDPAFSPISSPQLAHVFRRCLV